MANAKSPVEVVKEIWNSEVMDEEKWAQNSKALRAVGLFAVSVLLMRNFGDLMAI
ncbi:mitochondrial import receptor subunit TOM5-like protein [Wolffia australiana]